MGSLWGHLDEGIVFIVSAIWTPVHSFKLMFKVGSCTDFKPPISNVTNIRNRQIPIEIFVKLFCSVGGFLSEVIFADATFVDEKGHFRYIGILQHMSIFTLFFLHSVFDLLRHYKLLYIEGADYLSMAFSFVWYGTIFYFHTKGQTDPLEEVIHTLGIVWCFGAAFSALWEYRTYQKFLPHYFRCLMILGLGTWFSHMPFIMYSTDIFPGWHANPSYDRHDMRNVQFVACMFGFHLAANMTLSVVIYVVIRLCVGRGARVTVNNNYTKLSQKCDLDNDDVKLGLLDATEDEEL